MNQVWDALDIGENLGRCLRVARRYSGLQAGIMAAITGLIALTTFALAWTFDIRSTIDATDTLLAQVNNSLPYNLAHYAALIVFGITFAPTLMELGGAAFAKEGSTPFQWLVVALSIFDLMTDAPLATAFVSQYDWSQFGLFELPAYALAWVLWLGMSSFFFEMVCVCMTVTTIALVLRSFMRVGHVAQRA